MTDLAIFTDLECRTVGSIGEGVLIMPSLIQHSAYNLMGLITGRHTLKMVLSGSGCVVN